METLMDGGVRYLDHVRMWFVLARAHRHPARFVERAGWRVEDLETARLLMMAAHYVHAGKDIPQWLFQFR
ncbi:MAG TPA: hypothetical protein VJX23_03080 [Candidatus Binataceae bacterium]|nr:hypothetical protein [Candidatus Binataceae bacterium]